MPLKLKRPHSSAASGHTFEDLLDKISSGTEGENVSVRQLLDVVGRRAYGPVILILGFIALSPLTIVPGANWLVATVTWIIAIQIVFGRPYPWVPRKALDASFPRKYLLSALDMGKPIAKKADTLTKPRFVFLTEAPFINIVAIGCVLASLITYPLGLIPLGPILPSFAILLIGVGLAARDGIFLFVAAGAFVGSVLLTLKLADRLLALVGLS